MPGGDSPKKVFLVLEGGGARGLAHVGAVRAIEDDPRLQIVGVAGTSAGALVAALVAARIPTREMIDDAGDSPLLNSLGLRDATDLLGREWSRIARVRVIADHGWVLAGILLLTLLLAAQVAAWFWGVAAGSAVAASAIGGAAWVCWRLMQGVASITAVERQIDRAMEARLGCPRPVNFDASGLLPLRIVATDLVSRSGRLFSEQVSPEQSVAQAVSASAAIPFLFRPVMIQGCPYCDGGIVSNLPVWAFDEDRLLDPDVTTVAIEIPEEDDGNAGSAASGFSHLKAIVRSMIFGSAFLNTRMVDGLEVFRMPLPGKFGVLSFDISKERAASIVDDARRYTAAQVVERMITVPERYLQSCAGVHEFVTALLVSEATSEGKVRVAVAERAQDSRRIVRIFATYNYDGHADDRLVLPVSGSVLGAAITSDAPQLITLSEGLIDPSVALSDAMHRYRRQLAWEAISWILAVPVRYAGRELVITVDSDIPLQRFALHSMSVIDLQEIADQLSAFVETALRYEHDDEESDA